MLEAKIVTANGDVVIASEYQNEDLFYAMRGTHREHLEIVRKK